MAVTWRKLAYEDDVVLKALFDADTFLYATNDDTPVAISPEDAMAALSDHAGAEFLFNTQKIGGVVDPTTAQQVATKKYVDDALGGVDEFTELTDTPADYAGAGGYLVAVNSTPDALEFVAITDFLEAAPTEDEAAKAPTSEWAFDHDADGDAHHSALHTAASHSDQSSNGSEVDDAVSLKHAQNHASRHYNAGDDELLLNELGEPDGAVAFDGQEATDLVLENSSAVPSTPILGKIYYDTDDDAVFICTSIA